MIRSEALAAYLDAVPDVLFARWMDGVVAQLRAMRPGRRSRRIYARALERSMADASAFRRLLAAEAQSAEQASGSRYLRRGLPPAAAHEPRAPRRGPR